MVKYCLEERGHGKFKYFVPKPVSGKKLKEMERSGEELFDSRQEAYKEAQSRKKD